MVVANPKLIIGFSVFEGYGIVNLFCYSRSCLSYVLFTAWDIPGFLVLGAFRIGVYLPYFSVVKIVLR